MKAFLRLVVGLAAALLAYVAGGLLLSSISDRLNLPKLNGLDGGPPAAFAVFGFFMIAWAALVMLAILGSQKLFRSKGSQRNAKSSGFSSPPSVILAVILSSLIAIATTALVVNSFSKEDPDARLYPMIALAGLVGAWLAVFGWASDRRFVAALGHLLSVGAPWDFFYPGAIVAILLGIVAFATRRNVEHGRLTTDLSG